MHLVEFSHTALGPGRKNNCLQKATVQSPWTTNGMATAGNVGTAGWFFFINFAIAWRHITIFNCLVYTKLNVLSYGYKLSFSFGGPIALHGLVHFLNTTGPSLTVVVYAYFDRYWQPFHTFSIFFVGTTPVEPSTIDSQARGGWHTAWEPSGLPPSAGEIEWTWVIYHHLPIYIFCTFQVRTELHWLCGHFEQVHHVLSQPSGVSESLESSRFMAKASMVSTTSGHGHVQTLGNSTIFKHPSYMEHSYLVRPNTDCLRSWTVLPKCLCKARLKEPHWAMDLCAHRTAH